MGFLYAIKKKIIQSSIEKKRRNGFDLEMCERHTLPENAGPLLNNSYYFGANGIDGTSLITRLAFRKDFAELFILYTSNGRFLSIEDSALAKDKVTMSVECVEPGKLWHIVYEGELKDSLTGAMCPFAFDMTFEAKLPIFSSAYHGDIEGLSAPIARQKWNKEFFRNATGGDMGISSSKKVENEEERRNKEQHHYEQTGRMKGCVIVDGIKTELDLPASRDHSFGPRKWGFMNDHIWLMAQTEAGEALNLQMVNYPFAKTIYVGYTDIENEGNATMTSYSNLVYDHSGGMGSDTIEIDMHFNNGKTYHVKAVREVNIPTPFDGGDYFFQETIGNFEINGIKARGTIEYGFNRDVARWDDYQ